MRKSPTSERIVAKYEAEKINDIYQEFIDKSSRVNIWIDLLIKMLK